MRMVQYKWLVLLAAAGAVAGCGKTPPPTPPAPSAPPHKATANLVKGIIYIPTVVNGETRLAERLVTVKNKGAVKREVLQTLLDAEIGVKRIFPIGSKVLSIGIDTNGTAHVDLSKEIRAFSGGSDEEAGAVNAIALTVAHFRGVKRVKITSEGQELESLGGHIDLTIPVVPDKTMVVEKH